MTQLKSILVATDLSPDAGNAVHQSALLAQQHGARLSIVHIVQPARFKPLREWFPPSIGVNLEAAQARTMLRRFAEMIRRRYGVTAELEVRIGDAVEELLRASARADLVVFDCCGKNQLRTDRTVDANSRPLGESSGETYENRLQQSVGRDRARTIVGLPTAQPGGREVHQSQATGRSAGAC